MKERDITKVIDAILAEIEAAPAFDGKAGLRRSCVAIRESAEFTAPEGVWSVWQRLAVFLGAVLPTPTPDSPLWVRRVAALVNDEPLPAAPEAPWRAFVVEVSADGTKIRAGDLEFEPCITAGQVAAHAFRLKTVRGWETFKGDVE